MGPGARSGSGALQQWRGWRDGAPNGGAIAIAPSKHRLRRHARLAPATTSARTLAWRNARLGGAASDMSGSARPDAFQRLTNPRRRPGADHPGGWLGQGSAVGLAYGQQAHEAGKPAQQQ